jgi:hypothetical protein
MEQDKVVDQKVWHKIASSLKNEMVYEDFQVLCGLHAKYMKHKYHEPNFCSCNAKMINQWIKEVSECLK